MKKLLKLMCCAVLGFAFLLGNVFCPIFAANNGMHKTVFAIGSKKDNLPENGNYSTSEVDDNIGFDSFVNRGEKKESERESLTSDFKGEGSGEIEYKDVNEIADEEIEKAFEKWLESALSKNADIEDLLPVFNPSAEENERLEFRHNGRVFVYDFYKNKRDSGVFSATERDKRNNRFGDKEQRKALLKRMLNLGFGLDIAVGYIYPNIGAVVKEIEKNVFVKARDAELKVDSASEEVFKIKKRVVGKSLNKAVLYKNICDCFLNDKKMIFNVPILTNDPKVSEEDFLDFVNLRSDFSTSIATSSADRKHNVKNALASLNKVEVLPGQVFSFNKVVGKRTAENGYRTAKIIVNNEFVDGLGGGVCQVSTTLYNAVLLAGLEVLEANKHSKQIGYVKYGFDAMVNFGSSDLKFRNNTNSKITIITNYSSKSARIRIFGEDLKDVNYKLKNEIINVVEPEVEILVDTDGKYADKVCFEDESFYLKRATKGMEIRSFRVKYVGGVASEEEFLRQDKYQVQNAVKVVGAKKREPNLFELLDIEG